MFSLCYATIHKSLGALVSSQWSNKLEWWRRTRTSLAKVLWCEDCNPSECKISDKTSWYGFLFVRTHLAKYNGIILEEISLWMFHLQIFLGECNSFVNWGKVIVRRFTVRKPEPLETCGLLHYVEERWNQTTPLSAFYSIEEFFRNSGRRKVTKETHPPVRVNNCHLFYLVFVVWLLGVWWCCMHVLTSVSVSEGAANQAS